MLKLNNEFMLFYVDDLTIVKEQATINTIQGETINICIMLHNISVLYKGLI